MKILKEAFITKTSIEDIVEMAEKHPVAIERLRKIRDAKKEGYFEDLVKEMYPNGMYLETLFDLLEDDIDMVEEELGIKFESLEENVFSEWKPDTTWRHIKQVMQKVIDRGYEYRNNEREEIMAALDKADRGMYSPVNRSELRNFHQDVWRKNREKKESLKESSYDDDEDDEEMSVVSALNSLSPRQKKRLSDRGAFIRDVADEPLTEANLEDVQKQLERAKSTGDDTQAWDLALCIENDGDLYRRFVTPAIDNLKRKIKRGVFDKTLAIQLFYYVVENSLKNHPRWFPYSLKDVSVPTRYLAAEELYNFFEDEIKEGIEKE